MSPDFQPLFDGELSVTQLSGKPGAWRLWRLNQTMTFFPDAKAYELAEGIEVPAGFVTDGPSIPRFLWVLLPVWGSWGRAGVLHDFLCCRIEMGVPHPLAPTRAHCDRMFARANRALGVGFVARKLLRAGVWIGTVLRIKTTMISHNDKYKAAQEAIAS